ncbi:hypothetical protein KC951_03395 [Candidatus Saccharibacteria bacterium]|nr:hypothetical protein [Candidatus Saccharibacteria bacterium]
MELVDQLTRNMARLHVRSPEGGTTIEGVPGATLETAHEVAELLESSAATDLTTPPSLQEVMAQIALLEASRT